MQNKYQAVSQGARRFGKQPKWVVSISNSRATKDHGLRRRFAKEALNG
jgi:hypothetical protein